MAKVGFFIQKGKVNKHGYTVIKAVVSVGSKNVAKSVGKVKPKHWNSLKQLVNKSRADEEYINHEEINNELQAFKGQTEAFMKEQQQKGIELTTELIKDFWSGKFIIKPVKYSFWEAWDEYLKFGNLTKAPGTLKSQTSARNYFKEFETYTGTKFDFDTITLTFHDKLRNYVIETKKQHYNYFATLTRRFKAFLNWSAERQYHTGTVYKKFKAPEMPGTVVKLSMDDLKQLYNFQFTKKRLERVRDIFCFACYTGLRISDFKRLTRDDIKNGMIVTYMEKVRKNKPLTIKIAAQAQAILDKYPDQYLLLPQISNKNFNAYIKEAAIEAGIDSIIKIMDFKTGIGQETTEAMSDIIHAHMTRRTFVSLAYKSGMPIETIKEITGIKSEKTIRRYLDIDAETLTQEMNKFSDFMKA